MTLSDLPATPGAVPTVSSGVNSDVNSDVVAGPVFTPAQIAAATFIATPVAGALLAWSNFAHAGRRVAALVVVVVATLVTCAVVAVDAVGYGAFTLKMTPLWAAVAFVAASFAFHKRAHDAGARSWRTVLVVAAAVWLAVAVVGAGAAAWLHVTAPSPAELTDDAVAMGPNARVSFRAGASRADAQHVADALRAAGYQSGVFLHVTVDQPGTTMLRLTVLAPAPLSASDIDVSRKMVHHVAVELGRCVIGRLVDTEARELATGVGCP